MRVTHISSLCFKILLGIVFFIPAKLYSQQETANERLLIAASEGKESEIISALKDSADVNAYTAEGITALMYASERGDLDIVKILLFNGADPNKKPSNGISALISAASFNNIDIADILIQNGADKNARDENGVTALMYAAAYGNWVIVDMLLFYGAAVSLKENDSIDALMAASYIGNSSIAGLLISKGADPNSKDEDGFTPLWYGLLKNNPFIIDTLLKSGAHPNTRLNEESSLTPLFFCRLNNYRESGKLIKKAGGRANWRPFINHFLLGFDLAEFNGDDYMLGGGLGIFESKSASSLMIGFNSRVKKNRILEMQSDGLYYQLWEGRSVLYLQYQKLFRLPINKQGFHYGPFIGIRGLYTFGRFEGLERHVNDTWKLVPQIGFSCMIKSTEFRIFYQYMDFREYKVSPHRIGISVAFHINLKNSKSMSKKIYWINEQPGI
jgi:ankyrin repeat protein